MSPSRSPFGLHLSSHPLLVRAEPSQLVSNSCTVPPASLGVFIVDLLFTTFQWHSPLPSEKKNLNSGAKPVFKEPCASLWPLDLPLWPLSPLHHACSCLQLLFGLSSAFSGGLPSFQSPSMPPKAPPTPQQGIYLCTCPCQPDLQPNPFNLWASSLAHRA